MTTLRGASPSRRIRPNDRRALEETVRRILEDHPEIEPDRVTALLEAAHGRTADATVQNYRLLLAEREVRRRLRAEAADRAR